MTPGVIVYRFSDRLFFANVHFFKRRVWAAVDAAPKPARHFVLDVAGVPDMDTSAAAGLLELHDGLLARNVSLQIARASEPLAAAMDRLGLVELIGADNFHATGRPRSSRWPGSIRRMTPPPGLKSQPRLVVARDGVTRQG